MGYAHGGSDLVGQTSWGMPMVGIPSGVCPWWGCLVGYAHGGSDLVGHTSWGMPMVGIPSGDSKSPLGLPTMAIPTDLIPTRHISDVIIHSCIY